MRWLTDDLKQKIRDVYEPKYKRSLTDSEVIQIAQNLTQFIEHFLRFKWRITYGASITE